MRHKKRTEQKRTTTNSVRETAVDGSDALSRRVIHKSESYSALDIELELSITCIV